MDAALAHRVCLRPQLLADREWYGSSIYADYMLPTRLDSFILLAQPLATGDSFHSHIVQRPRGTRPFGARAEKLLRFCQAELAEAAGSWLAGARDPGIAGLAPRLRQVLGFLLEGDSESQVARRLALSSETIHQYVKALYRHFRVNSRAELLAYFLRRSSLRMDLLCKAAGDR